MSYKTFKSQQEVVAVDIHTMSNMSAADYKTYLEGGLLFVDHHDILRSQPAGYPLAVTKAQLKELIAYLKGIESRVGSR